jgi:phage FluMu gp28-like protein
VSTRCAPRNRPAVGLYPYQQRWFLNRSRFKIGMFCRQAGKTFTSTLEIVDDCLEAEAKGGRTRWVILSRGERQAKEAMDEGVKRHLAAYGKAFEYLEYDFDPTTKALEVVLPGGSRITALPANPDTARGFSANVLLDEFAFHQDSKAIWKALFPVISNGWRLIVISTPNGKGNKFYELMTGTDPVWYRQTVDIYQAVADGLNRDIDELRRALDDEDAWAQEFELRWLDEASAWLSYEMINDCEDDAAGRPELYAGGPVYVGEDIGLRSDLWVGWACEDVGGILWTREIRCLHRQKFAVQDAARAEMMDRYKVHRWCMDQGGLGEKPVEDAIRVYGAGIVEGVYTSAPPVRLTLATFLKQRFEGKTIKIPRGDEKLRRDLHKMKKIAGPTGTPRFVVERDGNDHADRTWACALSLNGAANPSVPIEFQATGQAKLALLAGGGAGYHLTDTGFGTVAGAVDLTGF